MAAFLLPPRYELRRPLGKGSFGVIMLAHDTADGSEVAIKKVNFSGRTGWDRHECLQLLREVRLLRHFAHDNIMSLRDFVLPVGAAGPSWDRARSTYPARPVPAAAADCGRAAPRSLAA